MDEGADRGRDGALANSDLLMQLAPSSKFKTVIASNAKVELP